MSKVNSQNPWGCATYQASYQQQTPTASCTSTFVSSPNQAMSTPTSLRPGDMKSLLAQNLFMQQQGFTLNESINRSMFPQVVDGVYQPPVQANSHLPVCNQIVAGNAEDYPINVLLPEDDKAVFKDRNSFNKSDIMFRSNFTSQSSERPLCQIQSQGTSPSFASSSQSYPCSPVKLRTPQMLSPQAMNQLVYHHMQNNGMVMHQNQNQHQNCSPQFQYPNQQFRNQPYARMQGHPNQLNMQAGMVNTGFYSGGNGGFVQTPTTCMQTPTTCMQTPTTCMQTPTTCMQSPIACIPPSTPPVCQRKQHKFDKVHQIRIPIHTRHPKQLTKLDQDGEEIFSRIPDFLRRPKRFNRLQNQRNGVGQRGCASTKRTLFFQEDACHCCIYPAEQVRRYDRVRFSDAVKAIACRNYEKELEFDDVFGETFSFDEFIQMVPVFTPTYSKNVHFDYVKIARTSHEKEQKVKVRNIAQLFGVNFGSSAQIDHNNYQRVMCHSNALCNQRQYYRETLKCVLIELESFPHEESVFQILMRYLGCAPLKDVCEKLPEVWKALRIQSPPRSLIKKSASDKPTCISDTWSEHVCMVTTNNYHIFRRDYELVTKTMKIERENKLQK